MYTALKTITHLVQNEVLPFFAPERLMVLDDKFVRRNAHMEGIGLGPALSLELPLLLRAIVGEDLECGTPLLELHLPVEHDTGGHHNEVRSPDATLTR